MEKGYKYDLENDPMPKWVENCIYLSCIFGAIAGILISLST